MKIKNTSEILKWCKEELKLTKEQEDKVIDYVGFLEVLLAEERKRLDSIQLIVESGLRQRGKGEN